MPISQQAFLEPVIERGELFIKNFATMYFQKPSLNEVMAHLIDNSRLGAFPQLTGAVRQQMADFLADFELEAPVRYPDAKVGQDPRST